MEVDVQENPTDMEIDDIEERPANTEVDTMQLVDPVTLEPSVENLVFSTNEKIEPVVEMSAENEGISSNFINLVEQIGRQRLHRLFIIFSKVWNRISNFVFILFPLNQFHEKNCNY